MDERLKALKAFLDEIRTTYNTYVGARYVPRFTGLYDETQSYEALDVVDNGSGTSYIAKKPTPAGTPLTDTDYWFLYGSTNGAIINLQQQIDDMKDGDVEGSLQNQINDNTSDIEALTNRLNRRFIVLYDSYGDYPDTNNKKLRELVGEYTGITNYEGYTFGGRGFTNANGAGTFLQALQSLTIANPDTVTDIVVLGGQNDYGGNANDIRSAISDFVAYVDSNFPNATVSIGHNSMARTNAGGNRLAVNANYISIVAYRNGAAENHAKYLYGVEYIMHNTALISGVHPNTAGVTASARAISAALLSGKCDIRYSVEDKYDTTARDPLFSSVVISATAFATFVTNDVTVKKGNKNARITITLDSIGYAPSSATKIADADGTDGILFVGDDNSTEYSIACYALLTDGSDTPICTAPAYLSWGSNSELYMSVLASLAPVTNPNNVKHIYLTQFGNISCESIIC